MLKGGGRHSPLLDDVGREPVDMLVEVGDKALDGDALSRLSNEHELCQM